MNDSRKDKAGTAMTTHRESSLATPARWTTVACLLVTATAGAVQPVTAVRVQPAKNATRDGGTLARQPLPCVADSECDDRNACTTDVCTEGDCSNTPIAGCVPCDSGLRQTVEILIARGYSVEAHHLGITDVGDDAFSCLTTHVVAAVSGQVPGSMDTCPFPDGVSSFESWGPATAIIAGSFSWADPADIHVVVPIADEAPCNGTRSDGCNDPGDDRDAIDNAVAVADAAGVVVFPVMGTGTDTCALNLAGLLAAGTDGAVVTTRDAGNGLGEVLADHLAKLCPPEVLCPPMEVVFIMDTSGSMRDEADAICGSEACDDGNACTADDRCVEGVCQGTPRFDPDEICCDPGSGLPRPIDDGDPCTEDICNRENGRVGHAPLPNGAACDDGFFCTTSGVCSFGLCEPTSFRDCSSAGDACNVGVCNEDEDRCEPEPANDGAGCDDGAFCTEDTICQEGTCGGGAPHDCSDVDEGCFVGACDDQANACVPVPADEGSECDDGDICTVQDTCDDAGGCTGRDINAVPCTSDADCFGASCDTSRSLCLCAETPLLMLTAVPGTLPAEDCFDTGEEMTVLVRLGASTSAISGGDLYIQYDPARLEFLSIDPGAGFDPMSPFGLELARSIDETAGRINYTIGVFLGEPGTTGPAVMAGLRFRTLLDCTETELCFLTDAPYRTLLTDVGGDPVDFVPLCSGALFVDGVTPELTCPQSVKTNANAGTTRATVTWTAPSAGGGCDGPLTIECTATNSFGVNIDHLIQTGGLFPAGLSTFECTATDACGVAGDCEWTVEVNQFNVLEVDVELSPRMNEDPEHQPLTRCIEFEFFRNCVQAAAVVRETMSFGLPFDFPGQATGVTLEIPAGAYVCATARDPLHTLKSSAAPVIVGTRYKARFFGDPLFGGNWLVQGNLNGDPTIDIVDFGMFMNAFLTAKDPDTTCNDTGLHADINGDGVVDQLDMTFISLNFLDSDKETCCPVTVASTGTGPLTAISVAGLRERGLGRLVHLDLNGDGVFDLSDVRLGLTFGPRTRVPKAAAEHPADH